MIPAIVSSAIVSSAVAVAIAIALLVVSLRLYRRTDRLARSLDSAKGLRALERVAELALDHGATLEQVRSRVGPDFLIRRADHAAATVEIPAVAPERQRRPSPRPGRRPPPPGVGAPSAPPPPPQTTQTYGQGHQRMQPWSPPGGTAMDETKVIHPRLRRRLNGGESS